MDVDTGVHRDAIRRIVHIRPNAREEDETLHATLERGKAWSPHLAALADDIDRDVELKLYASPMATLIGGLEGLLTCPHG